MTRCIAWLIAVVAFLQIATTLADEPKPEKILEYFPGKWEWTRPDGSSGTVEWKVVSGGKAVAGAGTSTFGGSDFGLGGWDSHRKTWVHTWYDAKGGYGQLEWTSFEKDTYRGLVRMQEPGKDRVEGKTSCKIVDRNTFTFTVEPGIVETWTRKKQ